MGVAERISCPAGGIPSYDTFSRVFAALDPLELERSFLARVRAEAELGAGELASLDGKAIRGSRQAAGLNRAIRWHWHMGN